MLNVTVTLIIFLFPLAYSPGPGNMFFAANGARFGFWGTFQASVGYHVATWVVTFLIGLGFGGIATGVPDVLVFVKYAGSAYVLYLAWRLWRVGAVNSVESKRAEPKQVGFFDGVILLVLNPKAYLIISAMFSQFIVGNEIDRLALILWVTTVFTLNNWIAFSLWAYAGDKLLRGFRDEARARKLNAMLAVVLAGVAVWILAG